MIFPRTSGVLLHITSLPSQYGIGDLGFNSYNFIDFLKETDQRLWQVLPLGPTSFGDSPYQSFSSFAGNPLLISPDLLMEEGLISREDLHPIPQFSPSSIDYWEVIQYKTKIYKSAFEIFKSKKELQKAFIEFCEKNSFWLDDYALFCSVKDYYIEERKFLYETEEIQNFELETKNILSPKLQKDYFYGGVWCTWDKDLVDRKPEALALWTEKLQDQINYYKFLQFQFFKEWNNLKNYAHDNNIKIVGDMPIFVAYDSADVWSRPNDFMLDTKGYPTFVAGVPPDYFSATGQLWGNPLYNWNNHKKTNFKWWINRIKQTLSVVDILRIDHFRGFESYWKIPFGHKDAIGGKWEKAPGKELFTAIQNALGDLPIIAEDLGVITHEVAELRDHFAFPGMRVLQFAFDNSQNNTYLPHNYIKNTVVYTGTHDNDTTRGWYKTASETEKDNFRRYMNISGNNASWDLMRLASSSCANTVIFPMQDVLNLDSIARMNIPGVSSGNWQWRFDFSQIDQSAIGNLKYITNLFKRDIGKI